MVDTNFITINNKTYDLSKVSSHERRRLEHLKIHEEHKGHEAAHLEMFLILVAALVISQLLLVKWKSAHYRSFRFATLIGMWLVPAGICAYHVWLRFLSVWSVFSVVTAWICYLSTRKPVAMKTPRRTYSWFLFIYKTSYAAGIIGYLAFMLTLFGLNILLMIKPNQMADFALLLLFYGLYFGVVARDCAEVCSDMMAARIGYYTETGIPTRSLRPGVCAVCTNPLRQVSTTATPAIGADAGEGEIDFGDEDEVDDEDDTPRERQEKIYKLNCGHVFHDFCIRGWCIVGKKDTCPYCKERVDLKRMFKNPWEKPHLLYGNLLDWIRYLVAWQPVIFLLVHAIIWVLGLK